MTNLDKVRLAKTTRFKAKHSSQTNVSKVKTPKPNREQPKSNKSEVKSKATESTTTEAKSTTTQVGKTTDKDRGRQPKLSQHHQQKDHLITATLEVTVAPVLAA
ncbi:unnamed protein product [Ambrosiozyma monospora]|uniref:Unnamed protein product n=1 Tax=Ambrosiozyma monospora TaxID=43982 RepID=A0A9W6YWJ4_AMBMO|nr:unnamed protein product [Ambrosiozyma monospora]